jgi:very-long-chain enoyl-CoA reductase
MFLLFQRRFVFIYEYLGPILIMLLYASRPSWIYGDVASKTSVFDWFPFLEYVPSVSNFLTSNGLLSSSNVSFSTQTQIAIFAWVFHFLKRELETIFVHKFSRPTMPLSNLFKNSFYYWGFALVVGYVLCSPKYTPNKDEFMFQIGMSLMLVAELINFLVHLQLSMMRPNEGSEKREAPKGVLFSLVSCPNYTAEVLSWVGFSLATKIASSWAFTLVGFLQMTQWALQKHSGYKKSDENYKKLGRKAIVPFLI